MADARELYLELLKKSLLDELYIENEARLQYMLLSLAAQTPVREDVIRDIRTHRRQHVDHLLACRADGKPQWVWNVRRADGSPMQVDLRNVAEFAHTLVGRKRLDNIHELLNRCIADDIAGT